MIFPASINGVGIVAPLGLSLDEIHTRAAAGERPAIAEVKNLETGELLHAAPIPADILQRLASLNREPRLRRASAISLFSAAAGRAAIADAGLELDDAARAGLAVVFGVSSGGVQYTRRFSEQIIKQGANTASPLLFPETVYNAPASHLAAMLGINGATYTLVGDGTVGLQAAAFAAQLLATGAAERVLVVAAEELDWVILQAHHDWRLTCPGAALSEGAAAVLLSRTPGRATLRTAAGATFFQRKDAPAALAQSLDQLGVLQTDCVVSGENNTWVDAMLRRELRSRFPECPRHLRVGALLGDSLGSGALAQVIFATDALLRHGHRSAVVASIGWNQQAAAAAVERS